jgi:hypothetical protein
MTEGERAAVIELQGWQRLWTKHAMEARDQGHLTSSRNLQLLSRTDAAWAREIMKLEEHE